MSPVDAFHESGYVVIENAVRPEYLAALQDFVGDGTHLGGGRNLLACDPLFDDCLWYRTGDNTTDRPRRGIFTYYGHFWIKPTSYQERPQTFASMRHLWEGRGKKRRQLLGIERPGSEFNHPLAWETKA